MRAIPGVHFANRLRALRRITQAAFIAFVFIMPVLDILRYDSAARELIVLGQVWGIGVDEGLIAGRGWSGSGYIAARIFLKAMLPWLFILSIFPLLGFVGGRLFCGWLCPEGALFELYDFLTGKLIGRKSLFSKGDGATAALGRVGSVKRALYAALALSCMIVIPVLAGIGLTGFFINPRAIWTQIIDMELSGGLKAGVIGVFIYMTATGLVVRHTFCKYVCAAGLMQTLFGWISPVSVRVRFQKENISRCTDCKGCERACFMDIKPRTGRRDISCVNCGECINACRRELGEGCLFNYTMGEKGNIDAAPYARSGQSDVALRNTRPI